jgi:FkbM family methyltransferase
VGLIDTVTNWARPPARAARRALHRLDAVLRPGAPWDGVHHPVLARFEPWAGKADGAFLYDFVGVRTDPRFRGHTPQPAGPLTTRIPSPWPGYFELVFVLESVVDAPLSPTYTAVELGAGYGPWIVTAWKAMQRTAARPVRLVGVEMVEQHFRWMREHLVNNGIDPAGHTLIRAAVSDREGEGAYRTDGRPEEAFGQRLETDEGSGGVERVPTVTLPFVLRELDTVDLLHLDIQGAEERVLPHGREVLDEKVRRLIFATHSRRAHRNTRKLLREAGWTNVWDFGLRSRARTPFGEMRFADGLQAWLNPRLASGPRAR